MGFGDFFKSAATSVANSVVEKQEKIERYKETFQYKSDDELIKIFKSSSDDKKFAVAKILKDRGYSTFN